MRMMCWPDDGHAYLEEVDDVHAKMSPWRYVEGVAGYHIKASSYSHQPIESEKHFSDSEGEWATREREDPVALQSLFKATSERRIKRQL